MRLAFLRPTVAWGSAVLVFGGLWATPRLITWMADIPVGAEAERLPGVLILAFGVVIALLFLYALFAMAMGPRNLRTGYRIATPGEKRRARWVMVGVVTAWWLVLAALGIVGLSAVLPGESALVAAAIPMALFLAPLVIVTGAAIGILYAGALDPGLALRRSTIYGVLGVIGILVFTVLESVLSEWVEQRVPLPGLVAPVVAGLLVAALLLPLRAALRRWRSGVEVEHRSGTVADRDRP